MSSFGLIEKHMELSHIYLTVLCHQVNKDLCKANVFYMMLVPEMEICLKYFLEKKFQKQWISQVTRNISYLGKPLGGVGASNMIDVGDEPEL